MYALVDSVLALARNIRFRRSSNLNPRLIADIVALSVVLVDMLDGLFLSPKRPCGNLKAASASKSITRHNRIEVKHWFHDE